MIEYDLSNIKCTKTIQISSATNCCSSWGNNVHNILNVVVLGIITHRCPIINLSNSYFNLSVNAYNLPKKQPVSTHNVDIYMNMSILSSVMGDEANHMLIRGRLCEPQSLFANVMHENQLHLYSTLYKQLIPYSKETIPFSFGIHIRSGRWFKDMKNHTTIKKFSEDVIQKCIIPYKKLFCNNCIPLLATDNKYVRTYIEKSIPETMFVDHEEISPRRDDWGSFSVASNVLRDVELMSKASNGMIVSARSTLSLIMAYAQNKNSAHMPITLYPDGSCV